MTLLAIVLSLFIERVWTTVAELRSFAWFERLVDRFAGKGPARSSSGIFAVLAVMALPLIAVVIAHVLFAKIFAVLGLVELASHVGAERMDCVGALLEMRG